MCHKNVQYTKSKLVNILHNQNFIQYPAYLYTKKPPFWAAFVILHEELHDTNPSSKSHIFLPHLSPYNCSSNPSNHILK